MARVATIPGVESVGLATRVPFSPNYNRWEIWIPGRHQVGGHGDTVEVTTVSPEYFKTIGVPILEGRGFAYDDRPDTPRVAVVNETLARRFWPGESAVGKTFRTRGSDGPLFQIVGMSRDHKVMTIGEAATPFLHIARAQRPNPYCAVIARTRGDASALLRVVRRRRRRPAVLDFRRRHHPDRLGAGQPRARLARRPRRSVHRAADRVKRAERARCGAALSGPPATRA